MEKFVIRGGQPLKGTIEVRGAKNAATPILAACLLTKEPCLIDNLPLIEDVFRMIEILESLGVEIEWLGERKIKLQAKEIDPSKIKQEIVCQLRSSILFLGPLLTRFKKIKMPQPGGCLIGARPLDVHLKAFQDLGIKILPESSFYYFSRNKLKGQQIILKEFSVTATENILMATTLAQGQSQIKIAAAEPHIQDLAKFLKKMGAKIKGEGTHTLQVKGVKKLHGACHYLIDDPIEASTFLILGAATKSRILVKNVNPCHLDLVLEKLKEFGVRLKIKKRAIEVLSASSLTPLEKDFLTGLKACKVEARIYPGIPTDLQAPFGVLATQAKGTSLIHDTLFEGRFQYVNELKKMGANAIICDPHRALITGPTPLYGTQISSFDLRAGATLIIAALIAQGESEIADAYQVDRGYERIEERLQKLGADIKRVSD